MTDWNSPERLYQDVVSYGNLLHVLSGVYIWEFLINLDFDWEYISGARKFRWPMAIYFACRYLLLGHVIAELIIVNVKAHVLDCRAIMGFAMLASAIVTGLASLCLAIRAVAVWQNSRWVLVLVVLFTLGQWSLVLQAGRQVGTFLEGEGCIISHPTLSLTIALMLHTMAFDFLIMCLVTYKLVFPLQDHLHSRLVMRLYRDGIIYFLVATTAATMAAVMLIINLNPLLDAIFVTPVAFASGIAATRAVRRLNTFFGTSANTTLSGVGHSIVFKVSQSQRASGLPASGVTVTTTREIEVDEDPARNKREYELQPTSADSIDADAHMFPPRKLASTYDPSRDSEGY